MAFLLRRANPTFTNSIFFQYCRPASSSSATLASSVTNFNKRSSVVVSAAKKSCSNVVYLEKREVLSSDLVNVDVRKLIKIVDKEVQRLENAKGLPFAASFRPKTDYRCRRSRKIEYKSYMMQLEEYWYKAKQAKNNERRAQQQLAWMESLREFLQN